MHYSRIADLKRIGLLQEQLGVCLRKHGVLICGVDLSAGGKSKLRRNQRIFWLGKYRLWVCLSEARTGRRRFWNAFGTSAEAPRPRDLPLSITVEINFPIDPRSTPHGRLLSDELDEAYLGHSGTINVGNKWRNLICYHEITDKLVDVSDHGRPKRVIKIGNLDRPTILDDIADFVQKTQRFRNCIYD